MSIRPRKEEIAKVTELLESGEYDTAASLAEAVIKEVFALLQQRKTWALVTRDPGLPTAVYGPFAGQADAARFATRAQISATQMAYPVLPPSPLLERASEAPSVGREAALCDRCGHSRGLHDHTKTSRCLYGTYTGRRFYSECDCKEFAA